MQGLPWQTWTRCLKSDIAFISPKLSTLAVIKKHSQINEYFAFPVQPFNGFAWRIEIPLLLPELVASWVSNTWSSFPWFSFSIHAVTSSDDACIAVNCLVQPNATNYNHNIAESAIKKKFLDRLTWNPNDYYEINILDQFCLSLLLFHRGKVHIGEALPN